MAMERFPNKCCRCGCCYLLEACPPAVGIFGMKDKREKVCPALSFEGDVAVCSIAEKDPQLAFMLGVGQGCCIGATVYNLEGIHDFADMPESFKKSSARQTRKDKGI